MITATVLTPAGSGAIAVITIRGAGSWPLLRQLFIPANRRPLSETPSRGFRFGNFAEESGDEVILVVHHAESVEIHSHGGPLVVKWILDKLESHGVTIESEAKFDSGDPAAWRLLPFAKTVRCASILLDQAHGAYLEAAKKPSPETEAILRRNAIVGKHLIDPWKVVIAGRPNAGKSSLLNALAGYARSVVSAIPGTTRDTVTTEVAFDGWPVSLTDTAGLRESNDELENEGIRRAGTYLRKADLVVWVVDLDSPDPAWQIAAIPHELNNRTLVVFNKIDAFPGRPPRAMGVSATTGEGLPELIAEIVRRLVPNPPQPGEPVPYTPELAAKWSAAATL
ncbi:GTPase [Zavarzinella formosa]|uniref:GTPase n=1 Tax=Zavarzinella formosa TaxID=360055 RepID=UPI0002DF8840|nr:GTPase [Zavarzinella formosa]